MRIVQLLIICSLAYLCGSIPFGKIYGKWFKSLDIQKHGSGNIGFANAYRVLGPKLGFAVLLSDILKSFIPLCIAKYVLGANQTLLMYMGLATILGHAFPVWLRFKGGKSIATGLGAMFVIAAPLAFVGIFTYLVVFSVTRKSALGSLAGAFSLVASSALIRTELFVYCTILAFFAAYTHRSNILQMVSTNAD